MERDPADPESKKCLSCYFEELARRFENGYDIDVALPATDDQMSPPNGLFLVAMLDNEALGCGGLKFHGSAPAEVKRMWISPDARGSGLGRRLLTELEARASENGVTVLRLETNRALEEAINLYRSAGYLEVPAFNEEPYGDHWFEKTL